MWAKHPLRIKRSTSFQFTDPIWRPSGWVVAIPLVSHSGDPRSNFKVASALHPSKVGKTSASVQGKDWCPSLPFPRNAKQRKKTSFDNWPLFFVQALKRDNLRSTYDCFLWGGLRLYSYMKQAWFAISAPSRGHTFESQNIIPYSSGTMCVF